MVNWAIQQASELNCHLIQLMMDKKRHQTIEFYKKLGFVASHRT